MARYSEWDKPVSYWVIILGVGIAVVTAFAPLPTGSYRLLFSFLLLGILPYIVYGSLTDTLKNYSQVFAGIALLVCDLVARISFQITASQASAHLSILLCTVLIVLALPAGVLFGHLINKLQS